MRPHAHAHLTAGIAVALVTSFLAGSGRADPPPLSAPVFLPGDEAIALSPGKELNPEIAAGAGGFLAVWVDDRSAITNIGSFSGGPNFDPHIGSMWDLYAVRLDADGNVVDETPFVVAQQLLNQGIVDVAWNGENWLVMWTGQSGLACCPEEHRYAARVSPAGVVLDDSPIRVPMAVDGNSVWPGVVGSDGTNWLMVFYDTAAGGSRTVSGVRIAPDGTVLDSAPVTLASGGFPGDFDITYTSGQYFIVWSAGGQTSGGTILGLRVATDLTPLGSPIAVNLYSPSIGRNTSVATDGTDYLVVWWEDRYDAFSQLAGARVSNGGVVLDPDGLFLTEAFGYTNYEPAASFDGVGYVVVYDRSAFPPIDLFATRVSTSGEVLDYDTAAIPVSTAPERQSEAAVAPRPDPGDGTVVLWRDARHLNVSSGLGDIFATTLAPDGTVGLEREISVGAPRQTQLRLAANGTGYLAVFRSETSPATSIMAQRLAADGSPIDLEPVLVATGGDNLNHPSAAWDGTRYLIVWSDDPAEQVYGRRYASDLTPIDATPIAVLSGDSPDVAALGDNFLVVSSWEEPHEIRGIYGARVRSSDGSVLDGAPSVIGGNYAISPRVTAFGARWLAVWERQPSHDNTRSDVYAAFVDAAGTPAGSFVVAADPINRLGQPVVAAGDTEAMFAWVGRNGQTIEDKDIVVRRILADGTFLDPAGAYVNTAENAQFDPAIAWTGTEYLTAYGDFRNEERNGSKRGDLYASRIADTGQILDPVGFPMANDTLPEMFPDVAGQGGLFVAGGSILRDEAGYRSYRIALRAPTDVISVGESVPSGPRQLPVAVWPNPARDATVVSLHLDRTQAVKVAIFDASGRLVRTLHDGTLSGGPVEIAWDGRMGSGAAAPSGVYFVRVRVGGTVETVKLVKR